MRPLGGHVEELTGDDARSRFGHSAIAVVGDDAVNAAGRVVEAGVAVEGAPNSSCRYRAPTHIAAKTIVL